VNSNQTTMLQLAKQIELHQKMPEDLVNGLRARRRSVDIFHMDKVCEIDEDHCLKDYLIKPYRSNKAPGKTRKMDPARFEQAVVDVCPSLTHNPLSMMQLFNDIEQGIQLVSFKSVPAIAVESKTQPLAFQSVPAIAVETKTQPLAFGKQVESSIQFQQAPVHLNERQQAAQEQCKKNLAGSNYNLELCDEWSTGRHESRARRHGQTKTSANGRNFDGYIVHRT
jgi:hypothetical protein